MATVFKPGVRPKTFVPVSVEFNGPDGDPLTIPDVKFKYRSRKEYGALIDATNSKEENAYKPAAGEKFSLEKWLAATGKNVVGVLADSIESWGIDLPVTTANLEQLYDETPAAINALNEKYSAACREGRLGN
ncbi:MAG: phage tail assembly chaperone [Ottowia sp.]|uniref:phage tail assembly chaperone n=1 Tax=Ottowia sp. TaxID=1898956 RepID=UPI003C746170